ncbi:helix-turn-helix domain-containing protein [Streptomyces sp. enrichment culture]|uniref:helix-turn-helix domain-containing protein n=1 Tax=Streptomyces sp. enrichment culture TaxID=1795815 RepID=UPI003F561D04
MSNTYGNWLRQQREAAGLTQQQLADLALMTRSHIAHIEAGRRMPSLQDAQRLDAVLNTGNVLSTFLPGEEPPVAEYFEAVRVLEQQAMIIREFALSYVPGILQTERYARAVLTPEYPRVSKEKRDRNVVTRLERAKVLDDPVTPAVWALLDESVLRRHIGGPDVMAEQIEHLIQLAESGRVRLHVVPFAGGGHPLLTNMLTLLWFADQPPVAYGEGLFMSRLHDIPSVVQELKHRYDCVLGNALPFRETLALLKATAKDYARHD